MNRDYWAKRHATVIELIEAMDRALLEFAMDSAKQTVSLDTTQTRVSWTRANISEIQRSRQSLLNELSVLETRLGCGGSFFARPAH